MSFTGAIPAQPEPEMELERQYPAQLEPTVELEHQAGELTTLGFPKIKEWIDRNDPLAGLIPFSSEKSNAAFRKKRSKTIQNDFPCYVSCGQLGLEYTHVCLRASPQRQAVIFHRRCSFRNWCRCLRSIGRHSRRFNSDPYDERRSFVIGTQRWDYKNVVEPLFRIAKEEGIFTWFRVRSVNFNEEYAKWKFLVGQHLSEDTKIRNFLKQMLRMVVVDNEDFKKLTVRIRDGNDGLITVPLSFRSSLKGMQFILVTDSPIISDCDTLHSAFIPHTAGREQDSTFAISLDAMISSMEARRPTDRTTRRRCSDGQSRIADNPNEDDLT
ncbi:hypothetical protein Aduo_009507 [Ancylostoma duodenale]